MIFPHFNIFMEISPKSKYIPFINIMENFLSVRTNVLFYNDLRSIIRRTVSDKGDYFIRRSKPENTNLVRICSYGKYNISFITAPYTLIGFNRELHTSTLFYILMVEKKGVQRLLKEMDKGLKLGYYSIVLNTNFFELWVRKAVIKKEPINLPLKALFKTVVIKEAKKHFFKIVEKENFEDDFITIKENKNINLLKQYYDYTRI